MMLTTRGAILGFIVIGIVYMYLCFITEAGL